MTWYDAIRHYYSFHIFSWHYAWPSTSSAHCVQEKTKREVRTLTKREKRKLANRRKMKVCSRRHLEIFHTTGYWLTVPTAWYAIWPVWSELSWLGTTEPQQTLVHPYDSYLGCRLGQSKVLLDLLCAFEWFRQRKHVTRLHGLSSNKAVSNYIFLY